MSALFTETLDRLRSRQAQFKRLEVRCRRRAAELHRAGMAMAGTTLTGREVVIVDDRRGRPHRRRGQCGIVVKTNPASVVVVFENGESQRIDYRHIQFTDSPGLPTD